MKQTWRMLGLIGQLGLTILVPPLLLIGLAYRFSFGVGGMLAALLCGLISSACGAVKLYRSAMRRAEKEQKNAPAAFNRHE